MPSPVATPARKTAKLHAVVNSYSIAAAILQLHAVPFGDLCTTLHNNAWRCSAGHKCCKFLQIQVAALHKLYAAQLLQPLLQQLQQVLVHQEASQQPAAPQPQVLHCHLVLPQQCILFGAVPQRQAVVACLQEKRPNTAADCKIISAAHSKSRSAVCHACTS